MRFYRKKLIILLGLSACILAACGGKGGKAEQLPDVKESEASGTTEEAGPVSIRFCWWGGDSRHEATEKIIEAFQAKNPEIEVAPEYGAWQGWEEKQSLSLLSGNAADVMQVNWNWLSDYGNNGENFVDIEEYSNIIDLSQFSENALDLCRVNGKLISVPVAMTGRCFFWNKSTFDEIGVPIPTDEESLFAAGKAFKEYGDDYYPLAMGEFDRALFLVYYLQCVYNKPWVVDNVLNYTVEEIQKGLDFLNRMEAEHVIPKIATINGDMADSFDKNPKWIDGFYAGIYEYDTGSTKCRTALEQSVNKPDQEFVLGEFVQFGEYKGGITKLSMGLSIPASSKHPEAAAKLINYLLNDPEGIELGGTERGIPCSAIGKQVISEKNLGIPIVIEANSKVTGYAPFLMDIKFENAALKANPDGIYYKVFGKLSAGEYDAKAAATELAEGITECFE